MQLRIKNLTIGYGSKSIVNAINLGAEAGDFIVLIGKNGAGKSTLIKSLTGIIPVQKGEIYVDNHLLSGLTGKKRTQYTGVVLTDRIEVNLSVFEFIGLGRQAFSGFFDTLSATDKEKVEQIIQKLQLEKLRDKNLNELSDGERQKVLIGRVLAQETPIILLDEPTAHLDLENKAMVFSMLKELAQKENKIIIVSTHDINLVLPTINKIWLISEEKVKEIDKKSPDFIHLFDSKWIKYDFECKSFRLI